MPSKGLRRTSLSTDTKFDADNNARKPLKPLLCIGAVMRFFIYFYIAKSSFLNLSFGLFNLKIDSLIFNLVDDCKYVGISKSK